MACYHINPLQCTNFLIPSLNSLHKHSVLHLWTSPTLLTLFFQQLKYFKRKERWRNHTIIHIYNGIRWHTWSFGLGRRFINNGICYSWVMQPFRIYCNNNNNNKTILFCSILSTRRQTWREKYSTFSVFGFIFRTHFCHRNHIQLQ